MTSDQHLSDEELGRYLAVADQEGDVPAEFAARLWSELEQTRTPELVTNEPAHYVALGENPVPVRVEAVAPTPLAPKRRPYVAWAAAAAVAVVVALAGIALTQGDTSAPVASEGGTTPGDSTPLDSIAPTSTAKPVADADVAGTGELDFAQALGLTEVTTDSVTITFAATERTAFNATVRSGSQVAATSGGVTATGAPEVRTISNLVPATTYTVEVTLTGPPSIASSRLTFRTPADPNDPRSFDVAIQFETVELNDDQSIDVVTNLCAEVAFALLDPDDRSEIARSDSDGGPCRTEHALTVGNFASSVGKTAPYIVIIEAEAVDGGGPTGNVVITTVSVAE